MANDYISKWKLYIASYFPLYIWLLLININYNNFYNFKLENLIQLHNVVRLILIVFIIISVMEIRKLFVRSGSVSKPLPNNMEIRIKNDILFNYMIVYIYPLLTFDIYDSRMIIFNTFTFLLIGFISVNIDNIYTTAAVGLFGFKIFRVLGFPSGQYIISNLSYDEIETIKKRGDEVIRYKLGDGIYIITRKKNNK